MLFPDISIQEVYDEYFSFKETKGFNKSNKNLETPILSSHKLVDEDEEYYYHTPGN